MYHICTLLDDNTMFWCASLSVSLRNYKSPSSGQVDKSVPNLVLNHGVVTNSVMSGESRISRPMQSNIFKQKDLIKTITFFLEKGVTGDGRPNMVWIVQIEILKQECYLRSPHSERTKKQHLLWDSSNFQGRTPES
jgi:hypothetical protein